MDNESKKVPAIALSAVMTKEGKIDCEVPEDPLLAGGLLVLLQQKVLNVYYRKLPEQKSIKDKLKI